MVAMATQLMLIVTSGAEFRWLETVQEDILREAT
jgi:hypothetical protein